ncbi:hypothetical protein [Pelomonas sp. Root1237]|uniref:hypothetical protein n=1 Tax=Pelomonas sp. Root1237 TaxID=1736434 RepID=UPI0012F844DF|nr:hypothetical protein [Pelomonas sp. Root1237]
MRQLMGSCMSTGPQRIEAVLARQLAEGASAAVIADASCEVWRRIDAALSPIVGRHGVSALLKRSLHLTRTAHPALAAAANADARPGDFRALRAVLAGQASAEAAALNAALLGTFYDLLSSLIGATLTERLLDPVWAPPSTDAPAQDSQT